MSDIQPAHNLQVVGCSFARDTSNEARLIYVGLGAKSVVIDGCDATVLVEQPCPTAYSDAPHITIEPPSGGASSEVTIIGCTVRDLCQYIPLKVDDGQDLTDRTGGISTTALVGAPLAGTYRVSAILVCTTGDPDFLTVTVSWSNELGAQSHALLNNIALDSTGEWWGECVIHAVSGIAGVPIVYSVTKAGSRAVYNLYLRGERLL